MSFGERLTWMVNADTRGLKEGFNSAKSSVGELNKALSMVGAGLSFGILIGWLDKTGRAMAQLEGRIRSTGVSGDFLQSLTLQTERIGMGAEMAADALNTFAKQVGLAKIGLGEWLGVAREMNISLEDQSGKMLPLEEQLYKLMDAISAMSSQTDRAAAASKVFGDGGIKLVEIWQKGSEAFKEQTKAYKDMGLLLDEEKIRNVAEAWRGWQIGVKGVGNVLVSAFGEGTKVVSGFVEHIGVMALALKDAETVSGRFANFLFTPFRAAFGSAAEGMMNVAESTVLQKTATEDAAEASEEFRIKAELLAKQQEAQALAIEKTKKEIDLISAAYIKATKAMEAYNDSKLTDSERLSKINAELIQVRQVLNDKSSSNLEFEAAITREAELQIERGKILDNQAKEGLEDMFKEMDAKERLYYMSLTNEGKIAYLQKQQKQNQELINSGRLTAVEQEKLIAENIELQIKLEELLGIKIDENNDKRKVTVKTLERQLQLAGILRQASTGELTTYSDEELAERVTELDKQRRATEHKYPYAKFSGYQQPYDLEEADIETEMARREAFRRGLSSYEDTKGREYEFTVAMKRILSQNENYNAQLTESTKQTNLLERIDKNLEGRFTQ